MPAKKQAADESGSVQIRIRVSRETLEWLNSMPGKGLTDKAAGVIEHARENAALGSEMQGFAKVLEKNIDKVKDIPSLLKLMKNYLHKRHG